MSLALTTITGNIAAISVTGVVMCDIDDIPTTADLERSPHFYPEPNGFVQTLSVERDSFGSPTTARKTVRYTLLYSFAYAPAGAGRNLAEQYAGAADKAYEVLDALIANDNLTGAIDMVPAVSGGFGALQSPDGSMFIGCHISIDIVEFVN